MSRLFPIGHRNRGAGLSDDQIPTITAGLLRAEQRGRTFYVNSTAPAGGSGTGWLDAFPTLAAALVATLPDDRIYLAPQHVESFHILTIDKPGLTIVGFGSGRRRPMLTLTQTGSHIAITAPGVTISNVQIDCSVDEVVNGFDISAADVLIDTVDYVEAASNRTIQRFIHATAGADRLEVCNCRHFVPTAAGGPQSWIHLVGPDDVYIHDNIFHLTLNNHAASATIHASVASVRGIIARNTIVQLGGATQLSAILLAAGSTAFVIDNRCAAATTALAAIVNVGANGYAAENYVLNTPNRSGILDPVVDI